MRILGIESTCDETGAAVVLDGTKVISNIVSSSLKFYKKYGGVVPEVAAREQVKVIIPTIDKCVENISVNSIDAIAVSYGPGLIGSLLIGVESVKALAFVWDKPLIGVNHLVGHIYSCWLQDKLQIPNSKFQTPEFPIVALVVSGGHTDLIYMKGHKHFQWLGGTRDDAAGEAFDKVARVLGLSYPGGPEIERLASQTRNSELRTQNIRFTRPMINEKNFDFSFSGLKTQVVSYVKTVKLDDDLISQIAFEFQDAVVDTLVKKTLRAAEKLNAKSIVVGGGVAANSRLKEKMEKVSGKKFKVFFPNKSNAIDNGAMIASAAFFNFRPIDPLKLSTEPSLHFI